MSEKIFDGVSQEQFLKLNNKLSELGILLTGNSGEVSGLMGIKLRYNYDAQSEKLYILILDKPFLLGNQQIFDKIQKAINS